MSKSYTPTLESITLKAKYIIPIVDFGKVPELLEQTECSKQWGWVLIRTGESVFCLAGLQWNFAEFVRKNRVGIPCHFIVVAIEHVDNGVLVEVECRPVMWYRITQTDEKGFTENEVQEALLDCASFVKRVMSVFKGRLVEPVSVYPIIQRVEIKNRLLNLGLREIVNHLDDAEKHIVQNNFVESLTSSRTAFEKTIDWQMNRRGLEQTNNYKNNLERLKAKGYLDADTIQLLQSYYHCLSAIGVHEKGTPPGLYEAQMARANPESHFSDSVRSLYEYANQYED